MANWKILIVLAFGLHLCKSDITVTVPNTSADLNTHPKTTTTAAPITTTIPTTTPNTTVAPTITPNTTVAPTITPNTTVAPTITPNTTVAPNTTTTTTTTPKPTSTTTTTTTTPKPTSTTTTTTTTAPTTSTTPAPPIPGPMTGNWSLNFTNSNNSCLLFDGALQIEVLLENSTSKKINVPTSAKATGICDNSTELLNLEWDTNMLTISFTKNVNTSKFELEYIIAALVNLTLPDGVKNLVLIHNKTEFSTQLGHSYKCAKIQNFNMTEENQNVTVAYLHLSHLQVEAFSNVTKHVFNEAIDCEASNITSDIVPIVVGCVLAILVIVVLVAYLVGRRRCQSRGYLSM